MGDTNRTTWIKSSHSGGDDNCVEIAPQPDGGVLLRDSKLGDASPVLRFTAAEWRAFVAGVRDGEFDLCWVLSDPATRADLAESAATDASTTEEEMAEVMRRRLGERGSYRD